MAANLKLRSVVFWIMGKLNVFEFFGRNHLHAQSFKVFVINDVMISGNENDVKLLFLDEGFKKSPFAIPFSVEQITYYQ